MHVAARKPDRLVEYIVQVGLAEPMVPLLRETGTESEDSPANIAASMQI